MVTQTFTLPATLCGPVVLNAATNCYNCLAANGFRVNALQRQIDLFISSCKAAGSATTLPQAGVTIAADIQAAGENSGPGNNTTGGADGPGSTREPTPAGDTADSKNGGERLVAAGGIFALGLVLSTILVLM